MRDESDNNGNRKVFEKSKKPDKKSNSSYYYDHNPVAAFATSSLVTSNDRSRNDKNDSSEQRKTKRCILEELWWKEKCKNTLRNREYVLFKEDMRMESRPLIAAIAIEVLLLFILIWSPPIIDRKHIGYYEMDPFGTKKAVKIKETLVLNYDRTFQYVSWEIVNADGSTTLVAEFFYDKGRLKEGSWKWENGVYYVWGVGDNGKVWVPSEPPPDRQPP